MTNAMTALQQQQQQQSPQTVSSAASAAPTNRLQFNRLATERKTVHVMNNNMAGALSGASQANKSAAAGGGVKPQMLASYNAAAAAQATNNTNTLGTSTFNTYHHHHTFHNFNQPTTNMPGQNGGQNTLDYSTTGRANAAGSFLQKLSSKFSRR